MDTLKRAVLTTVIATSLFTLSIMALLSTGIAIYLVRDNQQIKKDMTYMEKKISFDSLRVTKLDEEFQQCLVILNTYKGLYQSLDSLIARKEIELRNCRIEFMTMVRRNRVTEEECRKQFANLRAIDSTIRAHFHQLSTSSPLPNFNDDSLANIIHAQRDSIRLLKSLNSSLYKKVSLGMLLRPTTIEVTPLRLKSSGKENVTLKAEKIEQLKICYTLPKNELAEIDSQEFFIRIINPKGETYTSSSAPTFKSAENGQSLPYSLRSKIYYTQKTITPCTKFKHVTKFIPGTHTIEIYHKGYLVARRKFELK